MNNTKRNSGYWLIPLILCLSNVGSAQHLSLDSCYAMAVRNFPLIKKHALLDKANQYNLDNAAKGYLPQLSVSGQATYQSETVDISKMMGNVLPPGIAIPEINKDQYRIQADLTQSIYDGGVIHSRKRIIQAGNEVQQQQTAVNLYSVKERINQLFFAILLMDEQIVQNELRRNDLQQAADKTSAAIANGAAFRSSLNELKAELINVDMATSELQSNRMAYTSMFELMINQSIPKETILEIPKTTQLLTDISGRPELKLFEYQKQLLDAQEGGLKADPLPRLNAFVQGGYGRPTLNIVNNNFGSWYMGGLRLQWNFGSLYTLKNNKLLLETSRQLNEVEKESFVFNTEINLRQQKAAIEKFGKLIVSDKELIEIRGAVKESAQAQLDNGVITTRDFIAHVNAENMARQNLVLHQIQLLQATYTLKYLSGN